MEGGRGWYSRGYLPHIDASETPQFLTWRLNDALPANVIETIREELKHLPDSDRNQETARRIEAYADAGSGSCLLRDSFAAHIVQETLFHDHLVRYELTSWVVMPNHVHVLLTPLPGIALGDILRTLKSVSSTKINRLHQRQGPLWAADYFDRFIRDEGHFYRVQKYIEWNPVKAKLCTDPSQWLHSSANPHALKRLESSLQERTRTKGPLT